MASFAAAAGVSLSITRTIAAPRERVFEAWSQPQHLKLWFGPSDEYETEAEVDLRVGGQYKLQMKHSSGVSHTVFGEYVAVEVPEKLVYTWSWESGMATDTLVTVEFREVGGATEVELTHERLPSEEVRAEHDKGWIGCMSRLGGLFGSAEGAGKPVGVFPTAFPAVSPRGWGWNYLIR